MLCVKEGRTGRQATIDFTKILDNPYAGKGQKVIFDPKHVYNFELEKTLDENAHERIQVCPGNRTEEKY